MAIASVQARLKDLSAEIESSRKPEAEGDGRLRSHSPKTTSQSSFEGMLNRMQTGQPSQRLDQQRAVMELLRLEMVQSTLSLGGESEAPQHSGAESLPNLLSGLLQKGYGSVVPGPVGNPRPAAPAAGPVVQTAPADAPALDAISDTAARFLGTPYVFGGEGPSGIDCSSFVQQVFQEHQVDLPRTAREQINVGAEVPPSELRKGDLVFFRTYASYPSHVGIYLGEGKMIHASSGKGEVTVSHIDSGYYRSRYIGARRIV